jgi:hypothetical protein
MYMKKQNILDYCESFDPQHLFSVIQFLEWFECCEDLIDPIQQYLNTKGKELARIKRRARQQFEREGMPLVTDDEAVAYRNTPCIDETDPDDPLDDHWRKEPQFAEPPKLPVVGFCPKCTSTLVGMVLPDCEVGQTGRHFYSECTACGYYTEIFKGRKGRYIEIKGE